ncbi:MAG: DNA topoisomerase I [Candidatus Thorarchaeota archaeon]|nr:DNA topoisomerase I [Candidatus Thorarchaeota archaeon]
MKSLVHNGIIVLPPPPYRGLSIVVRGQTRKLDPSQEEMAMAWVRKLGTQYVEDPVFVRNFMTDFSKALREKPVLTPEEIDFGEVIRAVAAERAAKEAMTREEKKADLERRKAERERLKERYGYAFVDGERMELANYQTEPSGIFMGRGEHPLRGRWKSGATHQDITLNLSPDAPRPEGPWGNIIWAEDCMWIAKWTDRLTGNTKYIWLHDSTPIKQEREEAKFNKALKIGKRMEEIREHIMQGITSDDSRRRMVAAVCYLIDRLSIRVGDEKDPDEADTVGATTLRVEHVSFTENSVVLDFLGKDSVPWHRELELPREVYAVIKKLYDDARERVASFEGRRSRVTSADSKKVAQIFPSVSSTQVNSFLGECVPELTAKVFRTFHATETMARELENSKVRRTDPDFIKKEAIRRANLEVARVMNHTKQAPKGWTNTAARYEQRMKAAEQRLAKMHKKLEEKKKRLRDAKEREEAKRAKSQETRRKKTGTIQRLEQSVEAAKEAYKRAKLAKQRIEVDYALAKATRTWNLGTSLKSYIHPRIVYRWCKKVDYDWRQVYTKQLQRKFAWVEAGEEESLEG